MAASRSPRPSNFEPPGTKPGLFFQSVSAGATMFAKKKQPPIRTLIGEGTVIRGELLFTDGLRIDGEVQGDVVASTSENSILVISDKARVHGKVKAGHVIINGHVTGPV